MALILQHALLLASLAQVSVNLAPDQPIAQVYADELLVVEFLAQDDTEFTADMMLTRAGAAPVTVDFGSLSIRAGAPRWVIAAGVPWQRGLYHARVETRIGGAVTVTEETFCRVDRPTTNSSLPVSVLVDDLSRDAVLRLQGLSTEAVSVDGTHPDLYTLVETATDAGFRVRVRLDPDTFSAAGIDPAALVDRIGNAVALWELAAGENPEPVIALARAIRSRAPTARFALKLGQPDRLASMLAEGAGLYFNTITVDSGASTRRSLQAFQREAEQAGYERLAFERSIEASGRTASLTDPIEIFREGYDKAILSTATFFPDGELGESYCFASTLAQRLGNATFLGDVAIDDNTVGQLFIAPGGENDTDEWTFIVGQQEDAAIQMTPGNVQQLRLFDALNNAMRIEPAEDGTISLSATAGPAILCGVGGTLPREAACSSIRREARALLELKGIKEHLGDERIALLKAFAECDGTRSMRVEFFGLLRAFPEIESSWHNQRMPRSAAVPLLAGLARLTRYVCTLDQEIGKPFLEPIDKTYAKCGEFQSRYLTGTGGGRAVQERGDWLLAEVQRLLDESRALLARGRRIEADAVAALAEWRARSLIFAAKAAPLSEPDRYAKESK